MNIIIVVVVGFFCFNVKLFHLALSLEFMHGVRVLQYLEETFKSDIADCGEDEA